MKLIKMRIRRQKIDAHTRYSYPVPYYESTKVKFGPIYEGGLPEIVQSDILPRNADDEFILIGVSDEDFEQFMKANNYEKDGFIYKTEEISQIDTIVLGDKWTGPQEEKITDQQAVLKVLAKVARKEVLKKSEISVIDPDDLTPGINKTKSFKQSLEESLKLN